MIRSFEFSVSQHEAGATVEQLLRRRGFSHALLVKLKNAPDGLSISGARVFTNRRLADGEILRVQVPEEPPNFNILPVAQRLCIVYEDEDLLVINKPAGTAVHPSQDNRESSLANGLAAWYLQRGEPFICRAIGRLDKNTSGLVLFAKNALSGCVLSAAAQRRDLRREYLALCKGELPPRGKIDAPIGRVPGSAILREVRTDGRRAVTHYTRLCFADGLSLARIWLETGRTHQIRVHMAHIGHPLPGDFLYHPDVSRIARHALHAARLRFPHPVHGRLLDFAAPLPADMAQLVPPAYRPK